MTMNLVVTGMISVGRIEELIKRIESIPAKKVTKTLVLSQLDNLLCEIDNRRRLPKNRNRDWDDFPGGRY